VTLLRVLGDGARRVSHAPALLVGLWLVTAATSLPLALGMRDTIKDHLGASLEAETVATGVNYDWLQEFTGTASGIGATFTPSVIGFAAVLDNLSAFIDGSMRPAMVTSVAVLYVVLLTFLAGGIIDRYARDRTVRAEGFFSACGVFFLRFVRLGVVAALAYGVIFGWYHPWLFDAIYPRLTADVTVERTAFLARAALYVVFAVPLAGCNLLFDYAKVRAVVEDRRSMLGALGASAAFLRRNLWRSAGLYLLNVLIFATVLGIYAGVAPGAGSAGWSMWFGFAAAQLYVIARLWVKLLFWASETALFQSRLAHAGYVRRAEPVWPDSPAAEAIAR
jgi:hypothetical protein